MSLYDTLKLAASISIAAPLAVVGAEFLLDGRFAFGVGFLALAALLLFFPEYLERRLWVGLRAKLGRIPLLGRRFRE